MRGTLALPALVALAAVACGTKKAGAPGPIDYDKGSFGAPEILYSDSASILVETTLAFAGDGTGFGAWTLCDHANTDIEDCDVGSVSGKGPNGWSYTRLTNEDQIQYSAPSLAASSADVELAYSRRAYDEYDDVWDRHRASGTTFGAPLDVTTAQDASQGEGAEDFSSVAIAPDGKAWVAYVRILPGPPPAYEVDVAPISGGAPKTAIPAAVAGGICDHPSMVIDDAGHKHVLADCIDTNGFDTIFYATDGSGGTFTAPTPMPGGNGGNDNFYASLALDPDGATLHGVWVGSPPCSASAGTCFEPYYARKDPGQPWTQPLHVAGTGNASEFEPSLAVDAAGDVLITWARAVSTSSYDADIFFTWSADGLNFSAPANVSNTPVGDDEYSAIAVDPATGRPQLIWVHDYDSIAHAAWSPTP